MAVRTPEETEPAWVVRAKRLGIGAWALVGIVALVGVAFWLMARIGGVLVPFILAGIIVYVLRPAVNWIHGRGVPRIWAVVITYIVGSVVLAVLLGLLVPPIVSQIQDLVGRLPEYWAKTVSWVRATEGRLAQNTLGKMLARWLEDAPARLQQLGSALASYLPQQAAAVGNTAFNMILAPILAFYVLCDLPAIRRAVTGFLPKDHQPEFLDILEKVDVVMTGYLRGTLSVSASLGVLTFVLFEIARLVGLGVPYALALSVAAAVTNVVPYFGPWATALVAAIVGLFIDWQHALVAFGVIMVAQQVEATFISPNIMSNAVDLHPALIIFALLVGSSQFGIIGMLLAIPVAAAAKAVFLHFFEKYVVADEAEGPGDP